MESRMLVRALIFCFVACFSSLLWAAPTGFIVSFRDGGNLPVDSVSQRITQATGLSVLQLRPLALPGAFVFKVELGAVAPSAVVAALRALPQTVKAHEDFPMRLAAPAPAPNDTRYAALQQIYLDSNRYASLRMLTAWGLVRGSSSQVVAVLDSGALFDHPELRGRWLPGYDFVSEVSPPTGPQSVALDGGSNDGDGRDPDASDPGDAAPSGTCSTGQTGSSFHGTAVASVLAATTNNNTGIAGIDGSARILPLRISGQCGLAITSDIIDAMLWAVGDPVAGIPSRNPTPAKVINFSFAGGLGILGCGETVYEDAIDRVKTTGAVFVTAAGNRGGALESPASCAGALVAGTVNADGFKTSYSAYGPTTASNVVLMTPSDANGRFAAAGNQQLPDGRPNPNGHTIIQIAGTSFSSPTLAGIVSLVMQARPDFAANTVINTLRDTALDFPPAGVVPRCLPAGFNSGVPCACTRARCGSGIVSPSGALLRARAGRALANPPFATVLEQPAAVRLDAALSTAVSGNNQGLTYSWRQVSGPAFTLQGSETATLAVQPKDGTAGMAVFELTVTDTARGAKHTAQTSVISLVGLPGAVAQPAGNDAAPAPPASAVNAGGGGGGGGRLNAALIVWLLLGLAGLRRVSSCHADRLLA